MVVETRMQKRYMVVGDNIISLTGFMPLWKYNEDLTRNDENNCYFSSEFDILKVWDLGDKLGSGFNILGNEERIKQWGVQVYERKEAEEMTLEEVCKLLGKQIKIVPNE